MPVNEQSEIVSNKAAQDEAKKVEADRAKVQAESDKAAEERSAELDKKFGGDGRADERKATRERVEAIKEMLRASIQDHRTPVKEDEDAKAHLGDFSLALQEKRADLPNKRHMTVEEFNDFMNDLGDILKERDQAAASSLDTLSYVIEKIRADSI